MLPRSLSAALKSSASKPRSPLLPFDSFAGSGFFALAPRFFSCPLDMRPLSACRMEIGRPRRYATIPPSPESGF